MEWCLSDSSNITHSSLKEAWHECGPSSARRDSEEDVIELKNYDLLQNNLPVAALSVPLSALKNQLKENNNASMKFNVSRTV